MLNFGRVRYKTLWILGHLPYRLVSGISSINSINLPATSTLMFIFSHCGDLAACPEPEADPPRKQKNNLPFLCWYKVRFKTISCEYTIHILPWFTPPKTNGWNPKMKFGSNVFPFQRGIIFQVPAVSFWGVKGY